MSASSKPVNYVLKETDDDIENHLYQLLHFTCSVDHSISKDPQMMPISQQDDPWNMSNRNKFSLMDSGKVGFFYSSLSVF